LKQFTPLEVNGGMYVYVLMSGKSSQWHIGSTKNLQKRILRHNTGKNRSTKHGVLWVEDILKIV
jgi:predicted GIY-YIG superfamily endonuclease